MPNQTRARCLMLFAVLLAAVGGACSECLADATVSGHIIDTDTGQPVAARLYIADAEGQFFHATSDDGAHVHYDRVRGNSREVHTSLSAGPFQVKLPAGAYRFTVERGHEYATAERRVEVADEDQQIEIRLNRWINMAERGWFSGDTHVHRTVPELPTIMLAEDLNVAFPLTAWVTDTEHTPARNNKNPEDVPPPKLIRVDDTHVIWPVNTEYEHFSTKGVRHTLGAVFVLNHSQTLDVKAPPVVPLARQARAQGALLELDKHNWPWSMMIAPVMGVDLYELSNNHIWRTQFLFRGWYPEYAPRWMNVNASDGFSERQWIEFGFWNYYALLNCGLKMKPTAGTASGVHPVPLGFGRVYVHQPDGFGYDKWLSGLRAGESFVTTGPMLFAEFSKVLGSANSAIVGEFDLEIRSQYPLERVELIVNSTPHKLNATAVAANGTHTLKANVPVSAQTSGWACLRCWEKRPNGRLRFAHSAPVYFERAGKPLRPSRVQAAYLLKRVTDEIARHQGKLDDASLAEYDEARRFYAEQLKHAGPPTPIER